MYVSTWRSACTVAETDFTLTVRVKEKSTGLPVCRSSKNAAKVAQYTVYCGISVLVN